MGHIPIEERPAMAKKLPDQQKEIKKEKKSESIQKPPTQKAPDPLTERLKTRLPEGTPEALVEAIFLDELDKNKN